MTSNSFQSHKKAINVDNHFHNFTSSQVIMNLKRARTGSQLTIPSNFRQHHSLPKFRVEFEDSSGAKYSFCVEGSLSKEKMTRIVDFTNELRYIQETTIQSAQPDFSDIDTNFSRVYTLLEGKFKFGSFNSSDVLEAYEQEFDTRTTLSTIATYLFRLTSKGLLNRVRNGSGWTYKLVRLIPNEQSAVTQEQDTPNYSSFTP